MRRGTIAAIAATAVATLSCAAAAANRPSPGTVANGAFTATRPGAVNYQTKPDLACPGGGAFPIMADDVATAAKDAKRPVPQPDGRLCAMADTLLGWDEKEPVPESVVRFIAWHFGIPARVPRVVVTVLETEDANAIAQRMEQPVSTFSPDAKAPRFGMATRRLRKGLTKAALVVHDVPLELDPVPRRAPPNGVVTIAGRALGDFKSAKVVASDPGGTLEQPPAQPGGAFRAEIKCNDRQGRMPVEIRGEKDGILTILANFPVSCGVEPPTSVAIAAPEGGTVDPVAKARELFDLMNRERAAAGRPPLVWDETVATVARSAAERLASGQDASSFNVIEALRSADVASPVVLQNPVMATNIPEANALVGASAVDRANVLAPEVTHAGVGVAPGTSPDGRAVVYATELLVRVLPPADVADVRAKLRAAIDRRREDARASKVTDDPLLNDVAQKFADLLAANRGDPPKARIDAVLAPLYKAFRTVNVTEALKPDPLESAEDPAVIAKADVVGVGAALGNSAALGKNSVFVVILTGTRR